MKRRDFIKAALATGVLCGSGCVQAAQDKAWRGVLVYQASILLRRPGRLHVDLGLADLKDVHGEGIPQQVADLNVHRAVELAGDLEGVGRLRGV